MLISACPRDRAVLGVGLSPIDKPDETDKTENKIYDDESAE